MKTHQNFSGLAEKDDAQIFDGKTDKECTKSYIVRQTTKDEIIQMYKDLVTHNKKHLLIAIEGTSLISQLVLSLENRKLTLDSGRGLVKMGDLTSLSKKF